MKLAIITDLHLGNTPLVRGAHVRSASHLVAQNIDKFLKRISYTNPDMLVNMGDLIRSQDAQTDAVNYKQALSFFDPYKSNVIHMLGNHEVKKLTENDVLKFWKEVKYGADAYGVKDIDGYEIIWVSFTNKIIDNGTVAYIPEKQLAWLSEQLKKNNNPKLLFSHYPLEGSNFTGNFYFDKEYTRFGHYNNSKELLDVLSEAINLKAVFAGHSHWIDLKYINGIPFLTLPSVTENIAAPDTTTNFPGIYTLVEAVKEDLVVKIYSGEFCFCSLHL